MAAARRIVLMHALMWLVIRVISQLTQTKPLFIEITLLFKESKFDV